MSFESRFLLVLWLLAMAAGLAFTVGLPAATSVLADSVQLALSATFLER